jgi:hypothetical protein
MTKEGDTVIDATWDDESIRGALGALDEQDMREAILDIEDLATQDRCLALMGLQRRDLGMINLGLQDLPLAESGPLPYGHDTHAGNGLWDGRYVFVARGGVAYVHRDWESLDAEEQPISTFPAPDLADETIGVCVSEATEWVEYGVVDNRDARAFRGHDAYRSMEQDLEWATQSFAGSLAGLCRESGSRMTFRATTRWLIDGSIFGELFQLMEPIALHGTIEFTRNRTKPNVFSIFGLTPHVPQGDVDTELTGVGDDRALAVVEQYIRDFCAQDDRYPYRDGTRVKVEVSA